MSDRGWFLSPARRLRDAVLNEREPAPARLLLRRPYYPWLVVGTTCIAAFIGQVDASIVQLALPTLGRAFDAQLDKVSWVAVGYVLAFASVLPVFARIAEISGRKRMYLLGFALFGLCVVAAVVLLAAFVREEHAVRAPLIDLRLFQSPAFSGGCLAVIPSYGMFFAMSFALVRGYHDLPLRGDFV